MQNKEQLDTVYNKAATTFADSRKNMRWEEVVYGIQACMTHFWRSSFSILDIGCGGGRLYTELQQQSWNGQYTGIDIAENILQEARKNVGQQDFRCLNMTNISSIKEQYDAIFMIASFHHLQIQEERQQVLQQVYDRLKEGGILFMTNWYLYSEENLARYKKYEKTPQNFYIKIGQNLRYYHGFYPNELEKLLVEIGFVIVENAVFSTQRNIVTICKK